MIISSAKTTFLASSYIGSLILGIASYSIGGPKGIADINI
jgi:hypothetical protein